MMLSDKPEATPTLASRLIAIVGGAVRRVDPALLIGLFRGQVNGVAGLDGSSKVPAAQLPIGVDVQAYHAILAALAAQSLVANKLPYGSGPNAFSLTDFTSFSRTLLACADAAAARAALSIGLAGATIIN